MEIMNEKALNDRDIAYAIDIINKIKGEYKTHVIGQEDLLNKLLVALFSEGHILLEGVPGLAKTRSIKILSSAIDGEFKRIQFTPDLLPSDIVGTMVFNPKESSYYTKLGPIFANFVLADEINRAPAKVQSSLLEAMQERQVTIGEKTYELPNPFMVLATQNPLEQEGTYPLPEAQIDRFLLKSVVTYPTEEEELLIMNLIEQETTLNIKKVATIGDILRIRDLTRKVYIDDRLKKYVRDIVFSTRDVEKYNLSNLKNVIAFGGSPRASIAFVKASKVIALMAGRDYVIPEDIKYLGKDILRHRVILTYEAAADNTTSDSVIETIFDTIAVP